MDSALLYVVLPELILAVGAMALLMIGVFTSGAESGGPHRLVACTRSSRARRGRGLCGQRNGERVRGRLRLGRAHSLSQNSHSRRGGADALDDFRRLRPGAPVAVRISRADVARDAWHADDGVGERLIALYLGLELQSLALYVIAAFKRDDVRSSEAGLKYFVLGALSSGMLLYGASLLYGVTGSTGYAAIAAAAKAPDMAANIGLTVGLVFVLVGLAFKVAAVPFHMWTPDVYQGAPTPVTAFFSGAPKVAAMALILRFTQSALPAVASEWQQIVIFLSIASMVLGAFAAIGQTNIKRLLAYSSIGHVGFALIGLAANNAEGTAGVLIYLAIYVAMTLGSFACVLSMRRKGGNVEEIAELSGLAKTDLTLASILGLLMFSLAGIPPLAGFWAKWYVFLPAIKAGLYPLAVIGVVSSVIGAYYYLRIVKVMFFDEAVEAFERA